MMATYTARQLEILNNLGRNMGFTMGQLSDVGFDADIPVSVTYSNGRGTFTRQTYDYLGQILSNSERDALRQSNLTRQSAQSNAFLTSRALLGRSVNPRSTDFVSSTGRTLATIAAINTIFDPRSSRLQAAGLREGDEYQLTDLNQVVNFTTSGNEDRVRISDPSGIFISSSNPILRPLVDVGYVLFPYTPVINVSHRADYSVESLTHSNYSYPFYQHSPTPTISIQATFSAQDPESAAYVLAVQHFFRSVTKMFYGKDAEAGTPPPVLRLDGHGDYQFSSVPIVITEFSTSLPNDVDYISVTTAGPATASYGGYSGIPSTTTSNMGGKATTRVPTVQQFQLSCLPLYSRKSISNDFGLRDFAAGKLLSVKNGRGGFI